MPILVSLGDARDLVVIIYGIVGILFFVVGIGAAIVIGFTVKSLLNSVKEMMDESIKPAVASVKDAAETVRGTTDFVGRTAVQPIAKAYGTVAGVKKGMAVLSNLKKGRRA